MQSWCLTPSHLSAISSPLHVSTTVIHTVQRDLPIQPPSRTELAPEHASYSTFLSTPDAGGVLLRVLQGGFVIELSSLTGTQLPPHRFLFPSPVLPHPGLVLHLDSELCVLVLTESCSFFRLSFPVHDPKFFHQTSARSWCQEYVFTTNTRVVGPFHVSGAYDAVAGLEDGGIVCIYYDSEGRWLHEQHPHASKSWLPLSFGSTSNPNRIVSLASQPPPTETSLIFVVSQDRYLKAGGHRKGISERIKLPSVAGEDPPVRSPSPEKQTKVVPLEDEPRRLVRVLKTSDDADSMEAIDGLQVMVFIPTPAGESGGFFQLYTYKTARKTPFIPIRQVHCPSRTALCDLRDFDVCDGVLYTLWDDQGVSALEWLALDVGDEDGEETWYRASLQPETDLTPAHLEELLLDGGSLTDVFMDVLLRPGVFSPYSLLAAVRQYKDALLTLPDNRPAALMALYPTLAENIAAIVGCTVTLAVDPATGLPQRDRFYAALKRDWEGFVARCRDFERRARWPLCLAISPREGPIVIERERVLTRTIEDEALQIHRELVSGLQDANPILNAAWNLRTTLSASTMAAIESQVFGMIEQELGDSYIDTLFRARESVPMEELSISYSDELFVRLSEINDFNDALQNALAALRGLDIGVKDEETDVSLSSFNPLSDWEVAVITSYTASTILARYDLCVALIATVFFAAESLQPSIEPLLAELFAVFRSLAMYRALAIRPAGDPETPGPRGPKSDEDDVLARLNNLRMMSPALSGSAPSASSPRLPTYSLLHRIISQTPLTFQLPRASHFFLDAQGLLRARMCVSVTAKEAAFVESLRRDGFLGPASEICRWLPRTPAASYIRGRIMLDVGRADQAAIILERLSGSLGPNHLLSAEEGDALRTVLPQSVQLESVLSYFIHTAAIFEEQGYQEHVITFNKMAIRAAAPSTDTNDLWFKVFRGYVALGDFEEAYMVLVSTPHDALKRESVSHLVQAMCEADAVERLLALNFVSFPDDVVAALSFKSRNAHPLHRPIYSTVLYSWYIYRGDFRSAALTMYLHARKLGDLIGSPETYERLAQWQAEDLLVAINALSAVEPRNAWFTIPYTSESGRENRKRRKMAHHIPEHNFAPTSKPLELVELEDLRWEHTLVTARLDLWQFDRSIVGNSLQLSAADVVAGFSQANLFEPAMLYGRDLGQDLTHVFVRLTEQCARLATREASINDDMYSWLLTDDIESWSGTHAQRGWRYLQLSLERHDDPKTDYSYRKAVFDTLLEMDRLDAVPSWLVKFFEENQPDYLIRAWLRKGYLYQALEHALKLVRKTNATLLPAAVPTHAAVAWLPYALIDEVVAACESTAELQASTRQWREELKTELATRIKKMQKWSKDSSALLS